MLVLSRKKDESIVINNDITIVVVEIRGDKVRLGIEAPKDVPVHRREVFEAIARGTAVGGGDDEATEDQGTPSLVTFELPLKGPPTDTGALHGTLVERPVPGDNVH
jgi:carbon storage regulator